MTGLHKWISAWPENVECHASCAEAKLLQIDKAVLKEEVSGFNPPPEILRKMQWWRQGGASQGTCPGCNDLCPGCAPAVGWSMDVW